jgi:hypothetical protein
MNMTAKTQLLVTRKEIVAPWTSSTANDPSSILLFHFFLA